MGELPADPFGPSFVAKGDTVTPRMLSMHGCSGSSAILIFTRQLLRYHGVPSPACGIPQVSEHGEPIPVESWPSEALNPQKNWLYEKSGNDIGTAIDSMNDLVVKQNESFLFKGMGQHLQGDGSKDDEWASLKPVFEKLHIYSVVGTRENMLDQVVCSIKDCIEPTYGYSVDANGNKANLCMERRGDTDNPYGTNKATLLQSLYAERRGSDDNYKAHVDIEGLITRFEREWNFIENAQRNLNALGRPVNLVTVEDLTEFQTDMPGAFERGVAAWTSLLTSLGVVPDDWVVRSFLKRYANTRPAPPPHSDVIYNYDAVEKALRGTKYEKYLRTEA